MTTFTEYWKSHYVTTADPAEVARAVKELPVGGGPEGFELVHFPAAKDAPNILISQGSAGHGYVFAELAYYMHLAGYNVFIMPKHGPRTINQLLARHRTAVDYITARFSDNIGVYSEGLGGYVAFYLALAHAPIRSLICENSPAIMTEKAYHNAMLTSGGSWTKASRRLRLMMPLLPRLARIAPWLKIPISSYLPWLDLVDPREDVERRLVADGYLKDPDFDRWYPLSAVLSLITTPPPGSINQLTTPTMFIVASLGPTPSYIVDLYHRLPGIKKRLIEIDGSVYWMISHPKDAASLVCDWFSETLQLNPTSTAHPGEGSDPADPEPMTP